MPAGMDRNLFDTICYLPSALSYSRALRAIDIPVADSVRPMRGIQVAAEFTPNPSSFSDCPSDFTKNPQELGKPTSVLALYYMDIQNTGNNVTGVPSDIVFEIRQGAGCVTTVRTTNTLKAKSFEEKDLLVQVSGLYGTEWEIWANVVPGGSKVRVLLAAVLGEYDDKHDNIILGPNYGPP